MENFNDIFEELNESESKCSHVLKEYMELKSIVSQTNVDVSNILLQEQNNDKIVVTNAEPCNKNLKTAVKSDPSTSNKKAVKNRIKHYHTIICNMEKFKSNDRGKSKFIENLKKANESSLEGQSLDPILQRLFAGQRES